MKSHIRDKIVYIPYPAKGDRINEYTSNMVGILREKYSVIADLAELTNVVQMLQTKAVFLNWIEQDLDADMKRQLVLHKILGAKVVWVLHNKFPHDVVCDKKIIDNMNWLADTSDVILLHSKSSRRYIPNMAKNCRKALYVPHILYNDKNVNVKSDTIREKYGISESDFVFTMFGRICPYKNIEGGIESFKKLKMPNAKLIIAGKPNSNSYAREIEKLCSDDNNIILDLKYISNVMLDGIIDISDVIIMPYKGGSSINSGVMIQAFSKGRTVIAPDICMARDMVSEGFFYMYRNSLDKVMSKAYENGKEYNRSMGERARTYMRKNNSETQVKKQLYKII